MRERLRRWFSASGASGDPQGESERARFLREFRGGSGTIVVFGAAVAAAVVVAVVGIIWIFIALVLVLCVHAAASWRRALLGQRDEAREALRSARAVLTDQEEVAARQRRLVDLWKARRSEAGNLHATVAPRAPVFDMDEIEMAMPENVARVRGIIVEKWQPLIAALTDLGLPATAYHQFAEATAHSTNVRQLAVADREAADALMETLAGLGGS
jgi:hypothetical protein